MAGRVHQGPATSGSQRLWTMGLGDLNQDGKVDLVFGGYDPATPRTSCRSCSAPAPARSEPAPASQPQTTCPPRIVDVNRDGKPDVVAVVFNSGLTTWFGDGTERSAPGGHRRPDMAAGISRSGI